MPRPSSYDAVCSRGVRVTVEIKITDTDMGFDAAWGALAAMDGAEIDGGLLDPEQATIGARHETGWRDVEARPWLSIAADQGESRIVKSAKDAVVKVSKGNDPAQALKPVGQLLEDLGREVIASQKVGGPPLAASTVENKGHGRKLIDKGNMLAAITHEVRVK